MCCKDHPLNLTAFTLKAGVDLAILASTLFNYRGGLLHHASLAINSGDNETTGRFLNK